MNMEVWRCKHPMLASNKSTLSTTCICEPVIKLKGLHPYLPIITMPIGSAINKLSAMVQPTAEWIINKLNKCLMWFKKVLSAKLTFCQA